jgi:hypothetical protein
MSLSFPLEWLRRYKVLVRYDERLKRLTCDLEPLLRLRPELNPHDTTINFHPNIDGCELTMSASTADIPPETGLRPTLSKHSLKVLTFSPSSRVILPSTNSFPFLAAATELNSDSDRSTGLFPAW